MAPHAGGAPTAVPALELPSVWWEAATGHGIRRFVTDTDSVAVPESKAPPETLRQHAHHAVRPSKGGELDEAGRGGERRLGTVALPRAGHSHVDQVRHAGGQRRQVERGLDGKLALPDGRVGVPQSRPGAVSGTRTVAAPPARWRRRGRRCRSARRPQRRRAAPSVERGVGHGGAARPRLRRDVPDHGGQRGQHVAGHA